MCVCVLIFACIVGKACLFWLTNKIIEFEFEFVPPWWRHPMETFSATLALCAGNSPVTGEFPAQWPLTRSFDVYFDLRLNKPLNKQSWGWWFETPSRSLWRHCNALHFTKHLTSRIIFTFPSLGRKTKSKLQIKKIKFGTSWKMRHTLVSWGISVWQAKRVKTFYA